MELKDANILHITNGLGYGGVQKVIVQLCETTKPSFNKITVCADNGVHVQELEKMGIKYYRIPDMEKKDIKTILTIIKTIRKIVKEEKIDIIHCHHRMAVLYSKLACKKTIIYNNHTIYDNKPKLTQLTLKNVHVIADGLKVKDNVCDFFKVPESQVDVIYNAVDDYDGKVERIDEIQKAKEEGYFIVGNSGRLHPQKGMEYFVRAVEVVKKTHPMIKFFIIGDGELRKDIENLINKLGLENNITLLGFRSDIKNTISQLDVLVLTSIYEGLPLTPMEAFSVSKAVIATNIDGTREVVEDGYNGILVESKNPESIAEAIVRVYEDRKLLETLNENSRKTFENKFSLEIFEKEYLNYYNNLAKKLAR